MPLLLGKESRTSGSCRSEPPGTSPVGRRLRRRARALSALAFALLLPSVLGCGWRGPVDSADVLVVPSDLRALPADSASRVFFAYWRSLQNHDLSRTVSFYSPRPVAAVGPGRLVRALADNAFYLRSVKPRIIGKHRRGELETLVYSVPDVNGVAVTRSVTLIRTRKAWRIYYDPFLSDELRVSAENRTQRAIDSDAAALGPKALRAGERAYALQTRYLNEISRNGPPIP